MDLALPFHTTEGLRQVDTQPGCSSCGGECPCPQACVRREDAKQAPKPATGTWVELFKWSRA